MAPSEDLLYRTDAVIQRTVFLSCFYVFFPIDSRYVTIYIILHTVIFLIIRQFFI
jgi:hypothetical protein